MKGEGYFQQHTMQYHIINLEIFGKDIDETKEYIKLQLPIIKGELQQATNKVNTYIATFGTILSLLIANIIIVISFLTESLLYLILLSGLIVALLIITLFFIVYLYKRRPMSLEALIRIGNTYLADNKKVNLYYFDSYTKLSFEKYSILFTFEDDHTRDALEQIYVNSVNVVRLYKGVKR